MGGGRKQLRISLSASFFEEPHRLYIKHFLDTQTFLKHALKNNSLTGSLLLLDNPTFENIMRTALKRAKKRRLSPSTLSDSKLNATTKAA